MFIQSCVYGVPSMIVMLVQMLYHQVEEYSILPGLSIFNLLMFLLCLFSQVIVDNVRIYVSELTDSSLYCVILTTKDCC